MKTLFFSLILSWSLFHSGGSFSPFAEGNQRTVQMVFTDCAGLGNEIVMDIHQERLRIRKLQLSKPMYSWVVDGNYFARDPSKDEANYQKLQVENRLTLPNDSLCYNGAKVQLPTGVKIRNVWQANLVERMGNLSW